MTTPNSGKLKILIPEPVTQQGRDINFNFKVIGKEIDLLDEHLENQSNPHKITFKQILSQDNNAGSVKITGLADGENDQDAVTIKQLLELKQYIDEKLSLLSLISSSSSGSSSSSSESSSSSSESSSSSGSSSSESSSSSG
ncbi:MAG: hypothetical protein Q8Q33_10260 [Chlamydiota bacterium]|nr:hypothetical protein [Chlamydiota bacterium]